MGNRRASAPRCILLTGILLLSAHFFFIVIADEIRYDSGGRRDPFIPLIGEGGAIRKGLDPKGLVVEGIIIDPNEGSMALINGELYKEGDHVQNANLIHIFHDRVILAQEDEEKTLWIREEIAEGRKKADETPEISQQP